MKKKVLLTILCVVCLLGITGCGMSKKEMLKKAEDLTYNELQTAMSKNEITAKETYEGNIYNFSFYISKISKNYVTLKDIDTGIGNENFKVYLDKKTLKTLESGEKITIVGKINELDIRQEEKIVNGMNFSESIISCEIKNAYLVNDIFEINGTVEIPDKEIWTFMADTSNVAAEKIEKKGYYTVITRYDDFWYFKIKSQDETYDITDLVSSKNRKFSDQGKTVVNNLEITNGDKVIIKGRVVNNKITKIESIEKK